MGSFSLTHWIVVLLVIVLLFGAKKIPELAKGLGSGIKEFKKGLNEGSEEKITQTPENSTTNSASTNATQANTEKKV